MNSETSTEKHQPDTWENIIIWSRRRSLQKLQKAIHENKDTYLQAKFNENKINEKQTK